MITTDGTALLRAIALFPEDDTPRLMYADYLQENGDEYRAEFVRVQCLIARTVRTSETCPHCGCDDGYNHNTGCVYGREDELLNLHEATWRRPHLSREWTIDERHDAGLLEGAERYYHTVTWVNGFPVVRCRLEEVGWVRCPKCGANEHNANSRGDGCMYCDGGTGLKWLPTQWAIEVVRIGGTFEVTDREPYLYLDAPKYGWARDRPTFHGQPKNVLPPVVWDEISMVKGKENVYDSQAEALSALNAAVHRLVCRAAFTEEVKL